MLLAMVFVVVIGVLAAALLLYAGVGARATTSYRIERTRRYASEAALQVGVARARLAPTVGTNASWQPCATVNIEEDAALGTARPVVASGSKLTVYCRAVDGWTPLNSVDLDGGPGPRDVLFEVRCLHSASGMVVDRQLTCGSGSSSTVVGRARVRFEVDRSITPIADRAVIPKVVTWTIRN